MMMGVMVKFDLFLKLGILKSRPTAKSLDTVPEYATASHLEKRSNSFTSERNEDNQVSSKYAN